MLGGGGQGSFSESVIHELDPTVAGCGVDAERKMAGAEARMTALLDITLRTAETVDQKIAKTDFRGLTLVLGVHGPEDIVLRDLTIEGADEADETVFSDQGVKIFVVHKSFKFSTGGRLRIMADDDMPDFRSFASEVDSRVRSRVTCRPANTL